MTHTEVLFGGSVGQGEVWQSHFSLDTFPGQLESNQDALGEVDGKLHTFLNTIAGQAWSPDITYDWIKGVVVDDTGHWTNAYDHPATAVTASSGTRTLPHEVCCAMTLYTARPGRSGRGRMYIPMGKGIDTNGFIPNAMRDSFADALKTFVNSINTWNIVTTSAHMIVWSKKLGQANAVTKIGVGNVSDTQRRRRNHFVEARNRQSL